MPHGEQSISALESLKLALYVDFVNEVVLVRVVIVINCQCLSVNVLFYFLWAHE